MKARIVDIEGDKATIKTQGGKFVTIPRKKFKFDISLGQNVVIEKDNGKFYILPESVNFWGDDEFEKPAKAPKKHNKVAVVLAAAVVTLIICFTPILYNLNKNKKEDERIENLTSCITVNNYEHEKAIECYEKYGGEDKEQRIKEENEYLEYEKVAQCLNEAYDNYKVSDEEIEDAGSDVRASLVLVKRYGAGFQAQRDCYVKYGKLGDYGSEIDALDAKISENNAMVEYGESIERSSNSSQYYSIPSYSSSISCTSNTIGSSTFTSCY